MHDTLTVLTHATVNYYTSEIREIFEATKNYRNTDTVAHGSFLVANLIL